MNVFKLNRVEIDGKKLVGRRASDDDASRWYSDHGVYELDGKPTIIYGTLGEKYDGLVASLKRLSWITGTLAKKTLMGESETRNFGFCTRRLTRDYCSPSALSLSHPREHEVICEMGRMLNAIYEEFAPESAAKHSDMLRAVSPGWTIPGTRFTSGIVNNSNELPYHYDSGNHEGVFSCMVVFRRLCNGGHLVVPEIGARFMIHDHSFFLFDGQALLHGVTPMRLLNKNGYRYSLVYYSRRGMEKCGSPEAELVRARKMKAERERRRVTSDRSDADPETSPRTPSSTEG